MNEQFVLTGGKLPMEVLSRWGEQKQIIHPQSKTTNAWGIACM